MKTACAASNQRGVRAFQNKTACELRNLGSSLEDGKRYHNFLNQKVRQPAHLELLSQ